MHRHQLHLLDGIPYKVNKRIHPTTISFVELEVRHPGIRHINWGVYESLQNVFKMLDVE